MTSKQEFLSCNWIEHGLNFRYEKITLCCMCFHKNFIHLPSFLYPEKYINYASFIKFKDFIRMQNNSSAGFIGCVGCKDLKVKKWENDNSLSFINFDLSTNCNAKCVYCHQPKASLKKNFPKFDIIKNIKLLYKQGYLKNNGLIMFGGGEPTLFPEFEELIKFFVDKDFKNFKIHSSGIKYSKAISKILKKDSLELIISVDSGRRDLYKQIKKVDCYDSVWKNIQKYVEFQNNNKTQVKLKYILIKDLNDNENDIMLFLNKAKQTKINSIRFDFEIDWYMANRNSEENLVDMFKLLIFAKKMAKNLGFNEFYYNAQAETAIMDHSKLFEEIKNMETENVDPASKMEIN